MISNIGLPNLLVVLWEEKLQLECRILVYLKNLFYIDKIGFIKEWWEREDSVTLLTRPGRFGKTLTMSMVEYFFSVKYKDRGDLFE